MASGHDGDAASGSGGGAPAGADRAAWVLSQLQRRGRGESERWSIDRGASVMGLLGSLRHRVGSRTALAVGAGAVVLAAGVVALLPGRSGGEPMPPVTVPSAASSSTTVGPGVVVQAAGAVRAPGVYRLPVGSRVVDLLDRAGGPAPDLDLERTNLAALLIDGTRVWLPRLGESVPMVVGSTGGTSGSAPALVDLNHASIEQLDTLPGIGRTLATAIVSDRERRGRFRSIEDLNRVKGLTRSKIDAVRELVVIG